MTRIFALLEEILSWITASVLFAIMTLTFIDVATRGLLQTPVTGAFEVTELLLVVLVFTSIPLASRAGQHIAVDLLYSFTGKRLQWLMGSLADLLTGVAILGLSWLMLNRAIRVYNDGVYTAVLNIRYWPFVFYVAFMIFLMGLIHLLLSLRFLQPASATADDSDDKQEFGL